MKRRKIAFVDRDGTIIAEPPDQQIDRLDKLRFVSGAISGLRALCSAGFELVLVSNQDGLGTESFAQSDFDAAHRLMLDVLASEDVVFAAQRICPHLSTAHCDCRKPAVGLMRDYLADDGWSRQASVMIGDRQSDLDFAANLGVRGLRIGAVANPDWRSMVAALTTNVCTGVVHRKTRETDIRVRLDRDDGAPSRIATGIGFYDHMLEQLARHGGFRLELECAGDLHIDAHHTVEDCALALGEALAQVTADKRGLGRYGFVLPMDEARARVSLDLSGRAYCHFDLPLRGERVGELPTQMVGHFFHSLASAAQLTLHVEVSGDNDHHMVESAFKATGRALRQALTRAGSQLPTTKGML